MKNPYRLAEDVFVIVLAFVMIAIVFGIIHATSNWKLAGAIVAFLSLISFMAWLAGLWRKKRDAWDRRQREEELYKPRGGRIS